jgi:hypothetical protein
MWITAIRAGNINAKSNAVTLKPIASSRKKQPIIMANPMIIVFTDFILFFYRRRLATQPEGLVVLLIFRGGLSGCLRRLDITSSSSVEKIGLSNEDRYRWKPEHEEKSIFANTS